MVVRAMGFVAVGCGVLMVAGVYLAQGLAPACLIVVTFVAGACAERGLGLFR